MKISLINAKDVINSETEIVINFILSVLHTSKLHKHDFYEIFLITDGIVIHKVNDEIQILHEGSLVFIRPDDFHSYEKYLDNDCKFINLAFTEKSLINLFNYLGNEFPAVNFLSSKVPPFILLSSLDKNILMSRLLKLSLIPLSDKGTIILEFRTLLLEIFTKYFTIQYTEISSKIPAPLIELIAQMNKKENFLNGIQAMKTISGWSHEYLCRLFKKYYDTKPTKYINSLKINHAAKLLINTDLNIIEISIESGFENLSHFYHMFKNEYKLSPADFRKLNQKMYF